MIVVVLAWQFIIAHRGTAIVSANGRLEATEINIAAKYAGRIVKEFVDQGDYVTKGEVVAKMDTDVLQAQLREAQAKVQEAHSTIAAKRSKLAQSESDKAAAQADVIKARGRALGGAEAGGAYRSAGRESRGVAAGSG